jgi:hypothetical protein
MRCISWMRAVAAARIAKKEDTLLALYALYALPTLRFLLAVALSLAYGGRGAAI